MVIHPGQVVTLYCDFLRGSPNTKYLLVACIKPQPILFIINSKVSLFVQTRTILLEGQVKIEQSLHPFLKHDSWLDCAQVCLEFTSEEIEAQLSNGLGKIQGEIHESLREIIRERVEESRTIERRFQKQILDSWPMPKK